MNKKIILFLLAILVVGGSAGIIVFRDNSEKTTTAVHAVLAQVTPEELVNSSDGVIVGIVQESRVDKVASTIRLGKKDIVTTNIISIEKYISNPHNLSAKEITVQVIGGTIGDETMEAEEAPKLKKEDRVLIFLKQVEGNNFTVYGWSQGKYTISADGKVGTEEELPYFRSVFGKDMTLHELEAKIASVSEAAPVKN